MARFDWKDGVEIDNNPFPKRTEEHDAYQTELESLFLHEFVLSSAY